MQEGRLFYMSRRDILPIPPHKTVGCSVVWELRSLSLQCECNVQRRTV